MNGLTKLIGICLIALLSYAGPAMASDNGSIENNLKAYINKDFNAQSSVLLQEYSERLDHVLVKLKSRQNQYKLETDFLKYAFYSVHRKMLGKYDQYALFSDLFKKGGAYDCVTASILYAVIFEELNIPYVVKETDYHVYVLAYADGHEVLIETTDPLYGFVTDQEEIVRRKDLYSGMTPQVKNDDEMKGLSSEDPQYQNSDHVDNEVTFEQLPALQYYNQAIKYFNAGNIQQANTYIKRAEEIFPTERIKNTASYMFSVVFEN